MLLSVLLDEGILGRGPELAEGGEVMVVFERSEFQKFRPYAKERVFLTATTVVKIEQATRDRPGENVCLSD